MPDKERINNVDLRERDKQKTKPCQPIPLSTFPHGCKTHVFLCPTHRLHFITLTSHTGNVTHCTTIWFPHPAIDKHLLKKIWIPDLNWKKKEKKSAGIFLLATRGSFTSPHLNLHYNRTSQDVINRQQQPFSKDISADERAVTTA